MSTANPARATVSALRAAAPKAPEHPLGFIGSRLLEPLHRHSRRRLGEHQWRVASTTLWARWPDTGGYVVISEDEAAPIVSWLLVDPRGEILPAQGHGAVDIAREAMLKYARECRGRPTVASCSDERFWEIVDESPLRWELLGGRLYAMAGATPRHELIVSSVITALKQLLRPRGCVVMGSNVYVAIGMDSYCLPDVVVVCSGKVETRIRPGRAPQVTNPTVLVEVVSKSTEHKDRVDKLALYQQIPSLKAYLIVEQHQRRVDLWTREGDHFEHSTAFDGTITLQGVPISIADFYDQVSLDHA